MEGGEKEGREKRKEGMDGRKEVRKGKGVVESRRNSRAEGASVRVALRTWCCWAYLLWPFLAVVWMGAPRSVLLITRTPCSLCWSTDGLVGAPRS